MGTSSEEILEERALAVGQMLEEQNMEMSGRIWKIDIVGKSGTRQMLQHQAGN